MSRLEVPDETIKQFNRIGWQKVFADAEKRIKDYREKLGNTYDKKEHWQLIKTIRTDTAKLKRLREYYKKKGKTCNECGKNFVPTRSGHDTCYDCWGSRKAEVGRRKTEVGRRKAEDGGRKSEDR